MPRRERAALSPSAGLHGPLLVVLSLVLPLGITLVLIPFRDRLANAAAALVLVMVIVGVAAFGDRRAGWIATVSSGVWFDFFLTEPYERFSISSAHDIETTVALVVVGGIVTELAVRSRQHFTMAFAEGNYLALIHDLSDLVATGAPAEAVIAVASEDLIELLGLSQCRFEPAVTGAGRARLARNGEVELGDTRFEVARDGLPAGEIELVVQGRSHEYGCFVMQAGTTEGVSIEQRVVALAIADQVGGLLAASPPQ